MSPQLTMVAAVLTRSKGMTLLDRIVVPALGPLVGVEPALSPEAVGCASTTFASMSLAGLRAGRGSTADVLEQEVGRRVRAPALPSPG